MKVNQDILIICVLLVALVVVGLFTTNKCNYCANQTDIIEGETHDNFENISNEKPKKKLLRPRDVDYAMYSSQDPESMTKISSKQIPDINSLLTQFDKDNVNIGDNYISCIDRNNELYHLSDGKFDSCQDAMRKLLASGIPTNQNLGFGSLDQVCPITCMKNIPKQCFEETIDKQQELINKSGGDIQRVKRLTHKVINYDDSLIKGHINFMDNNIKQSYVTNFLKYQHELSRQNHNSPISSFDNFQNVNNVSNMNNVNLNNNVLQQGLGPINYNKNDFDAKYEIKMGHNPLLDRAIMEIKKNEIKFISNEGIMASLKINEKKILNDSNNNSFPLIRFHVETIGTSFETNVGNSMQKALFEQRVESLRKTRVLDTALLFMFQSGYNDFRLYDHMYHNILTLRQIIETS